MLQSAETPGQHFWTPFLMAAACGSTGDEDKKLCSAPQDGKFWEAFPWSCHCHPAEKGPQPQAHSGVGGSSHLVRGLHLFCEAETRFPSTRWGLKWPLRELALQWRTSSSPLQPPIFFPQPLSSNSTSSSRTSSLMFSQCPLACSGSTTWEDAPFYPVPVV